MAEGWETLQVRTEVKKKLNELWMKDPSKPKGQKFYGWVNSKLTELAEHEERLERYGAFIKYLGAVDNFVNLFDSQLNKSITIWIDGHKKTLKCDLHQRDDCVHVGFCYGVKEIYDKLIDSGFRPPKKIS